MPAPELVRALASLAEPPAPEHGRLAELLGLPTEGADDADYTQLFLFELYPYASVYLGSEGLLGGEARDRIAGFWRALGETPPPEPDHLAALLGLYARLIELEGDDDDHSSRWAHARHALLGEHLLSWLPVYLKKLVELAPPFYRAWGELLGQALLDATQDLPETDQLPLHMPLHLREAAALEHPETLGGEDFLQALLAPVRTGMILTRSDLQRAAAHLDLGSRIGERKFVLKALLSQDAPATLNWLAEEAKACGERHRRTPALPPAIRDFWISRAESSSDLLQSL